MDEISPRVKAPLWPYLDKLGLKAVTDGKVSPAPKNDNFSGGKKLIDGSNTVENQEWQRAVQLAVNPIHLHHNSHHSPRFPVWFENNSSLSMLLSYRQ